jgi:hypothetical protein
VAVVDQDRQGTHLVRQVPHARGHRRGGARFSFGRSDRHDARRDRGFLDPPWVAAGDAGDVQAFAIFARIRDGKAKEIWEIVDSATFLEHLGELSLGR